MLNNKRVRVVAWKRLVPEPALHPQQWRQDLQVEAVLVDEGTAARGLRGGVRGGQLGRAGGLAVATTAGDAEYRPSEHARVAHTRLQPVPASAPDLPRFLY